MKATSTIQFLPLLLLFFISTHSLWSQSGSEGRVMVQVQLFHIPDSDTAARQLPTIIGSDEIVWPEALLAEEIHGIAQLKLTIGADGELLGAERVGVPDRSPLFRHTLESVRRLKFAPGKVDGQKQEMKVIARVLYPREVLQEFIAEKKKDGMKSGNGDAYPDFVEGAKKPTYSHKELMENVVYPAKCQELGIEGVAKIQVYLDEKGVVEKTDVLQSRHPDFSKSAIAAINKTEFTPAMQDGVPIKFTMIITVDYRLNAPSPKEEDPWYAAMKRPSMAEDYPDFVPNATPPQYSHSDLMSNIVYPAQCQELGIEGRVLVKVMLDQTGAIKETSVIKSDHKEFSKAAIEAIGKMKFQPATQNGIPINYAIIITVNFVLTESPKNLRQEAE